ncbi:5'-3' exonuclease PLD3-like [Liolophura sinensis]|uniref:5'-3' exonuclease PLD3-like n=1 Tax=Liolophura sinensis TaxID=3198878 RepID=UPI003159883B
MFTVVESIPQNLTYPSGAPSHVSTYTGLSTLLKNAQSTIEIASFYWTLQNTDVPPLPADPSSWEGQSLFDMLYKAGKFRKIKIRIAQNKPTDLYPQIDTEILASQAGAEVRSLDFDKLVGAGILHTKMWLIDRKHFYVGSTNLDWRSLTQVKELGGVVQNCSCMAEDMGKIFDVYWYLGASSKVPADWPASYSTQINSTHPAEITYNGQPASTYLSSSPASFCPKGRTVDIDAIIQVIREAQEFVFVAVMDYLPVIVNYSGKPSKFWPIIDDELRRAAFDRQVQVRVLGSLWNHTDPSMLKFLTSLSEISRTGQGSIEVKMFKVPTYTEAQARIPFARVNHNKYMVTERSAYIGTSNWSGDYFVSTGGIGLIVTQPKPEEEGVTNLPVRQQVEDIFRRDWDSRYSQPVEDLNPVGYEVNGL